MLPVLEDGRRHVPGCEVKNEGSAGRDGVHQPRVENHRPFLSSSTTAVSRER